MGNHRARWSAIGAAVAVSIGAGGLITFASAAGGTASVFTPITPCRLLDTRADGPAVGATPPRATPLGQGETLTIPARGSFGLCNSLSATGTGAVLNVTVVNSTAGSYLTVWPADKPKPLASSLNWVAGQGATPNQVTTALDPSGMLSLFNNSGTVDVIVDVVGVYEPASTVGGGVGTGPAGPAGPAGAPGTPGTPGTPGGVGPAGPPGAGINVMTAAAPDPLRTSGSHSSLVLDADGNPVVSYYDEGVGQLMLTHCDDSACAPIGDVTNVVDGTADVGQFTSLALDTNGFPVISYYDASNRHLKLAHCNDADCAGANESLVTVDTALDTGMYSSMALDGSGFPVISYYDAGTLADNLNVAHCGDATCTTKTITPVVTSGITGLFTSLEMFGGFPTIAFYDLSTENVMVKRCTNLNCSTGPAASPVVTTSAVGEQHLSLALDASGFPVISYLDPNFGLVGVAHCSDVTCSAAPTENQLPDPNGGLAEPVYSSIVLDSSGFPVVSYFDSSATALRVGRCLDADCVDSAVSTADNSATSTTGAYSSIVLDSAGNPIISSYDLNYLDLVVTRCADPFCNPRRIRSING